MKTNFKQQELLLMTDTTFSRQLLCEKDNVNNQYLSQREQLEEACWNGLLYEVFNDVMEKTKAGKRLCLWQVYNCSSFLEIELSEHPEAIEQNNSINPYIFLCVLTYN